MTVATKQDLREATAALSAEPDAAVQTFRAELKTIRRQIIAAVAVMLLVHLAAAWASSRRTTPEPGTRHSTAFSPAA
jgi:hypothetical protein